MTQALASLITQARALTELEVQWESTGGRGCPIGWEDCSQPVFESTCGRYTDYGDRGGPGDQHCRNHCPHGRNPPERDSG